MSSYNASGETKIDTGENSVRKKVKTEDKKSPVGLPGAPPDPQSNLFYQNSLQLSPIASPVSYVTGQQGQKRSAGDNSIESERQSTSPSVRQLALETAAIQSLPPTFKGSTTPTTAEANARADSSKKSRQLPLPPPTQPQKLSNEEQDASLALHDIHEDVLGVRMDLLNNRETAFSINEKLDLIEQRLQNSLKYFGIPTNTNQQGNSSTFFQERSPDAENYKRIEAELTKLKNLVAEKLDKSTGKKPKTTAPPPPPPPPAIYAFPIDPRNPSSNLNVPYTPLPTGYSQRLFGQSRAAFPVEEDSGDDDIDVANEDQIFKSYSFADSSSSHLSVPYVPLPVGFSLQAGGTSSSATLTASDQSQTSTNVYQLPFDSTLSVPYVPLPVGNNLELNGNSTNATAQSSDENQTSTNVYQLPFDSTLSVPYVPLPLGNNLELNGNSTNATAQSSNENQTSTNVYQLPFDSTLSVPYVPLPLGNNLELNGNSTNATAQSSDEGKVITNVYQLPFDSTLSVPYVPLPVGNNLELTGNSTNATVQSSDESKNITNVYQLPFDSTLIVPYVPLPVGNYLLLSSSDTYIPTLNFDNVKNRKYRPYQSIKDISETINSLQDTTLENYEKINTLRKQAVDQKPEHKIEFKDFATLKDIRVPTVDGSMFPYNPKYKPTDTSASFFASNPLFAQFLRLGDRSRCDVILDSTDTKSFKTTFGFTPSKIPEGFQLAIDKHNTTVHITKIQPDLADTKTFAITHAAKFLKFFLTTNIGQSSKIKLPNYFCLPDKTPNNLLSIIND